MFFTFLCYTYARKKWSLENDFNLRSLCSLSLTVGPHCNNAIFCRAVRLNVQGRKQIGSKK